MSEKIVLDLNDLFAPKSTPAAVAEFVAKWDVSAYADKAVELEGCAATWAHLMVAGKLFSVVKSLDFRQDDGKAGVTIPILAR